MVSVPIICSMLGARELSSKFTTAPTSCGYGAITGAKIASTIISTTIASPITDTPPEENLYQFLIIVSFRSAFIYTTSYRVRFCLILGSRIMATISTAMLVSAKARPMIRTTAQTAFVSLLSIAVIP